MSPVSAFHTKAASESRAAVEKAKGERDLADEFLTHLDELLSEGFNEVTDVL
jgi:flagellar basal body-associated protein FliL